MTFLSPFVRCHVPSSEKEKKKKRRLIATPFSHWHSTPSPTISHGIHKNHGRKAAKQQARHFLIPLFVPKIKRINQLLDLLLCFVCFFKKRQNKIDKIQQHRERCKLGVVRAKSEGRLFVLLTLVPLGTFTTGVTTGSDLIYSQDIVI